MAAILLTLLLASLGLIYFYLRQTYLYWQRRGVPHESPVYFFGNLKGVGRTLHFRDLNQRIYNRFKNQAPFVGVYMFFTKAALIMDLELIKHIMVKDFSYFHDRGIFHNVRDDPLTGHLLTLEGEEWRSMRSKLSPTFTSGKMKFMFSTVVSVGKNLVEACEMLTTNEVELKELCARYTTDVIGTCAFGIECNSLKDPNAEFRLRGRSIFNTPRHSQLVQAFAITNPDLARKLRMKFFSDSVSEFFINVVRETVAYRLKNNIKRNDFMDILIELKAENKELAKRHLGIDLSHGLTLEQMAAQAFVFFLAGFDTSSATMSFSLYELAMNTEIQEKLRTEILNVLKSHKGELTYEAMNEMPYLDQVIAETLRRYSVLPHIVRKTSTDYRVPNSEQVIEKGTTILIPIDAIHRDPEYYPQPNKFDPDRFTPEAMQGRHSAMYMPFGDGPRNCIGMRFGKMQTKIGLISLLKSYKFSVCKNTEIPIQLSKKNFLISAENGIYLHMERLVTTEK